MNLRILIYINPSNIDKVTHKFNLDADSGFIMATKTIDALNRISDNHYYLLLPDVKHEWSVPINVTIVTYPYINDALNNRYHFDTVFLSNYFNTYKHDIDACWTMLPENVSSLKAFFNKRREEIPIICYSSWLQNDMSNYAPSFRLRTIEGALDCHTFCYQSEHMLGVYEEAYLQGL